jgi:hypothetical protein
MCSFQYYTTYPDYDTRYKSLKINENLRIRDNIFENLDFIEISDLLIDQIKTTDCLKIYIRQNRNPILFLFIITKILFPYATNIKEIKVYQENILNIDQEIYLVLADYLKTNNHITAVKIVGKTIDELNLKNSIDFSQFNNNSKIISCGISFEESQSAKKRIRNKSVNYNFQTPLVDKFNNNSKNYICDEEKPYIEGEKFSISKFNNKKIGNRKLNNSTIQKIDNPR